MKKVALVILSMFFCLTFLSARNSKCRNRNPKNNLVSLIAFSCDRPLQLYALLESCVSHISGLSQITVIYRTSSDAYQKGYDQVMDSTRFRSLTMNGRFLSVTYFKQKETSDFKPLLFRILKQTDSSYVLFAVDDMVVTDTVDLAVCVRALEQRSAYGFYLRMGKNITYSYTRDCVLKVPECKIVENGIYEWQFNAKDTDSYWRYPHTVDMTIYRLNEIKNHLNSISFTSPNSLEKEWHRTYAKRYLNKKGLCFEHSRVVNIPLNRVQDELSNKSMNSYAPQELLTIFNEGLKLDILSIYHFNNSSAHEAITPVFCKR